MSDTDGLITRIGKWLDRKWEASATYKDLSLQEAACSSRHIGCLQAVTELKQTIEIGLKDIWATLEKESKTPKEVAELKERLGHLEVYVGMKRVVEPGKPAVAKSAFAM